MNSPSIQLVNFLELQNTLLLEAYRKIAIFYVIFKHFPYLLIFLYFIPCQRNQILIYVFLKYYI